MRDIKTFKPSMEMSQKQDEALIQALKSVPRVSSERWERVSELLPGKSKVQCVKRFMKLKEMIKTNRAKGAEVDGWLEYRAPGCAGPKGVVEGECSHWRTRRAWWQGMMGEELTRLARIRSSS